MTDASIPSDLLDSCDSIDTARVLAAQRGTFRPRDLGWDSLYYFNSPGTRDRRVAVAVYARLGLCPILLHGLDGDRCTCGRADCSKSAGKHPVSKGWQTERLDVDRLDFALQQQWRYNIGLRMGVQPDGSHMIAIDVDGELGLLDPLVAKYGPLPPTLTAKTPRGYHLLFRDPTRKITNRQQLAPGVDVRGAGGQIAVSPSCHQSGIHYSWLNVREPAELPHD